MHSIYGMISNMETLQKSWKTRDESINLWHWLLLGCRPGASALSPAGRGHLAKSGGRHSTTLRVGTTQRQLENGRVNMRPRMKRRCHPANSACVNFFSCKALIEYLLFLQEAEEPPWFPSWENTKPTLSAGEGTGDACKATPGCLSDFALSSLEYYYVFPSKDSLTREPKNTPKNNFYHTMGYVHTGKYLKIIPIIPHWQKHAPETSLK